MKGLPPPRQFWWNFAHRKVTKSKGHVSLFNLDNSSLKSIAILRTFIPLMLLRKLSKTHGSFCNKFFTVSSVNVPRIGEKNLTGKWKNYIYHLYRQHFAKDDTTNYFSFEFMHNREYLYFSCQIITYFLIDGRYRSV